MNVKEGIYLSGQIIKDRQDLTYLSWTRIRHSSGTAGSFFKAYSEIGGHRIYYKLSNYDMSNGITGHECIDYSSKVSGYS